MVASRDVEVMISRRSFPIGGPLEPSYLYRCFRNIQRRCNAMVDV